MPQYAHAISANEQTESNSTDDLSLLSSDIQWPIITDTSDPLSWNIRIVNGTEGSLFGNFYRQTFDDYNNNGMNDLIVCGVIEDNNERPNSGSCYLVSDEIVFRDAGPGTVIDLSDPQNYVIRFDGASPGSLLSS